MIKRFLPTMMKGFQWAKTVLVVGSDAAEILPERERPLNAKVTDNQSLPTLAGERVDLLVHAELHRCLDLDDAYLYLAQIDFKEAVIFIDEGNRSGRASGSKRRKQWQRNQPLDDYLNDLTRAFAQHHVIVHRYASCIVMRKRGW